MITLKISPELAADHVARRVYLDAALADNDSLIVEGLPIEVYHGDANSISKSGLDDVHQSGAHYYARHLAPDRPARETKGGQLEGSLAHCATLEPDEFAKRYAVGPDINRNTKDWKSFEAALPEGVIPIKHHQAATACAQALQVYKLPEIARAFGSGGPERSIYWTDKATGVRCRCRPDWLTDPMGPTGGVVVVDLKTFRSASTGAFQRQVAAKRYHVQAAFYVDGIQAALGVEVLGFVFAVVEGTYPYLANAMMLDDAAIDLGRREYRADLERYAACKASNEWPGYGDGVSVVSVPLWAFYAGEE